MSLEELVSEKERLEDVIAEKELEASNPASDGDKGKSKSTKADSSGKD